MSFTFSLFCTTLFSTYSSLCINYQYYFVVLQYYYVVVCAFAFASQPFTLSFPAFNVLHFSTVFAVIRFSVPFQFLFMYTLGIWSLSATIFEVLFQSFRNLYTIGYQQNIIGKWYLLKLTNFIEAKCVYEVIFFLYSI